MTLKLLRGQDMLEEGANGICRGSFALVRNHLAFLLKGFQIIYKSMIADDWLQNGNRGERDLWQKLTCLVIQARDRSDSVSHNLCSLLAALLHIRRSSHAWGIPRGPR